MQHAGDTREERKLEAHLDETRASVYLGRRVEKEKRVFRVTQIANSSPEPHCGGTEFRHFVPVTLN